MGIAENKQFVLDFYEAGARGDMDTFFALLADGVTWTNIGTTKFSGTYVGKYAIAEEASRSPVQPAEGGDRFTDRAADRGGRYRRRADLRYRGNHRRHSLQQHLLPGHHDS